MNLMKVRPVRRLLLCAVILVLCVNFTIFKHWTSRHLFSGGQLLNIQSFVLEKEADLGYVDKIEKLFRGSLTASGEVRTPTVEDQVQPTINLGMVLVNIDTNTSTHKALRSFFSRRTRQCLNILLDYVRGRTLHFIIVTNRFSAAYAGQLIASIVSFRISMGIIQGMQYRWMRSSHLPPIFFSLVDSDEIAALRPGFVQGMKENINPAMGKKDKYRADFYYVAPLYHLAFSALDRAVFIDASDMEFTVDVAELYGKFEALDSSKSIMSLGLDLNPHYFDFLKPYLEENQGSQLGQPGRFQGFNTGVVLYRLDRMRESEVFNSYLTKEKVNYIMKMFGYHISLAEQDFLTLLGFLHPELFQILPCQFNRQESIQYNKPPFEAVFDAYHNCGTKEDVKIFHLNGCGPSIDQCGFQPGPDSKHYKNILNLFLHMDIEICWLTLKSFADGNWDWQDSIFTADGEKYKYLETVEGDMRRRRRRRKREDTNVRDDMAEGREVEGVKLGGDKEELSWKLVFQMEK